MLGKFILLLRHFRWTLVFIHDNMYYLTKAVKFKYCFLTMHKILSHPTGVVYISVQCHIRQCQVGHNNYITRFRSLFLLHHHCIRWCTIICNLLYIPLHAVLAGTNKGSKKFLGNPQFSEYFRFWSLFYSSISALTLENI